MILFACEVAAAIWGFMNRDTVSDLHCFHPGFTFSVDGFPLFLVLMCPQISKELINFYDSAYIKAVDVSGSPSKEAAIKILDVFHNTVRSDVELWSSQTFFFWTAFKPPLFFPPFSSTAAVKATTPLSSNK